MFTSSHFLALAMMSHQLSLLTSLRIPVLYAYAWGHSRKCAYLFQQRSLVILWEVIWVFFLIGIHILISVIFIYFRRGKVRTMGKTLMKGVLQEVGQSHIKLFVFRKWDIYFQLASHHTCLFIYSIFTAIVNHLVLKRITCFYAASHNLKHAISGSRHTVQHFTYYNIKLSIFTGVSTSKLLHISF